MPSKTRLLLLTPQQNILKGKMVMAFFFKTIASQVDPNELPADWYHLSTRQQLMVLAKYLPDGWVFTIVRERAKNRPNRSFMANIKPLEEYGFEEARRPVVQGLHADGLIAALVGGQMPGGF